MTRPGRFSLSTRPKTHSVAFVRRSPWKSTRARRKQEFFRSLLYAGETGKVSWMQEPHREGVASHSDLESCLGVREGAREALTEAGAGWVLSREIATLRGVDVVAGRGRPHPLPRQRERGRGTPRGLRPHARPNHTVRGNREIPRLSAADRDAERMGKSKDPRP